MISCGCDDYEIVGVGEPRIVTCRIDRKCSDCGGPINADDTMYVQSMYNNGEHQTAPPRYNCERCGDLIESLVDKGFCVAYGGVLEQWEEYLDEKDLEKEEDGQ